jgi:hypothetical protein
MATIYSRGWITCECGPSFRGDRSKDERGADRPIRNSVTVKAWQTLVTDGERRCPWKVIYRYSKGTGTFRVTGKRELNHVGHRFREPALSGTMLHAAKDVTPAMHNKLQSWLRMRIPGPRIRQVR